MKRILFVLSGLALLTGCTERIDLELNDEDAQRLVVEGWVTDELKPQEVKLTLTTSYFYTEAAPRVSGATVTISDGTNTWNLTEDNEAGIYLSDPFAGEAMETYTLNINYNGENYSASSTLRPTAPIDSVAVVVFDPAEEFGIPIDPYYSVRLWSQELPGVGDSYLWKLWVNDEPVRDTLTELTITTDELFDGWYVADVEVHNLQINEEAFPGDTVTLEQWNIGYEGYQVFFGIANETAFNGGLFDAPPANVETNLSNGALGYFGAAGVSRKSAVIVE